MAYTTVDNPGAFFNSLLYAGSASTWVAHTGVGFQPDMTWHKSRTSTGWHGVADSVRGVDASPGCKAVYANETNAEETSTTEYLDGYQSDGFTTGVNGSFGAPSNDYVAWCWKAGTTSGITTDGATTITPSAYSFNTTSKFSILEYTGNGNNDAKVAHGLGGAPGVVLIKKTNAVGQWTMHHPGLATPNRQGLVLNLTDAVETDNYPTWSFWYNTNPDSVNFTLGDSTGWNNSGDTYIAYCWQGIQGYSKFGSYVGNGDADGAFVYTGFRPAYVMCKYTGVENWAITDDKRLGYNVANYQLYANATNVEVTNVRMDIVSNGFKARTTNAEWNGSGNSYIYMAFASSPFTNAEGVATNAR
tara:strand:- start:52 stop:1128 length:1077 start_codon:yes stop_codon:yes gene_type:complete